LSDLSARLGSVKPDDRINERLLERQHGVVSRSQALAMGITPSALSHKLRQGGPWQVLVPGVYLTVTGQPTRKQQEMAALLHAGPESAITGPSALVFWHMPELAAPYVDVLVPHECRCANWRWIRITRTRRMPDRVAVDGEIQYVLPARAVLDSVRGMKDLARIRAIVAGAVQQRVCKIELLAAELPPWPVRDTALLRMVLAEVAAGIRSAPEAELRGLIVAARLPIPLFNCTLRLDGSFLAQPDAYWPEHGVVAEVDSWQWHSSPEAWAQTLARHNRLEAAGLRVLHISPRQIRTSPEEVISQIAAALAHGRPVPEITARPAA
jgi:hypothetical protein